ncbi:MAG: ribonuclease HII [Rickettsiales bacterium]
MYLPDLSIEMESSGGVVAGVDEAGRGSWAGVVVAAAVILDRKNIPAGINDSKKLKAAKREELYDHILNTSYSGVGMADAKEIDSLNILEATKLAMSRAVLELSNKFNDNINLVLIDGNKSPVLPYPTKTVINGDSKSLSIAAASIIAKVTRDRIMKELSIVHPEYGWESNAGYGTKKHMAAIERYGITDYHRKSYKPIAKFIGNNAEETA